MLDETTETKLRRLTHLFLEENGKINLSAFRTEEDCWNGNVLDSVTAHPLSLLPHSRCLDLGTGGGFPLLPLAICHPDVRFTGMDATQKKIAAVRRITDALGLGNVELVCGRAEELGRDPAHRERYDAVTVRGVAPLNVLLEYASPFAKPKGRILCWKSMKVDRELEDALLARSELSCRLAEKIPYALPGKWGQRQIIVFEKRGPVSEKYPRKTGVPEKRPLV